MKLDESFKGFEMMLNRIKMELKMHLLTLLFFIVIQAVTFSAVSYVFLPKGYGYYALKYVEASAVSSLFPKSVIAIEYEGETYRLPPGRLKEALTDVAEETLHKLWKYFLFSSFVYLLYPFLIVHYHRKAKDMFDKKYVRGAKLITPAQLNRQLRAVSNFLSIGEVKMPVTAEPKHCFVVGRPGVGKTVFISQTIEKLKKRKDKGVIYDFKGDYLSKFYDPASDIIFNPLDLRCRGWNIFNEVSTVMDIDAIAHSLIPQAYSQEPFWNDAARDVFSGILHYLYQNNLRSNRDIWSAVTAPGKEITEWLKSIPGGQRGHRYIEDASSKQAMSVFSVMMQYVKAFEFMAMADGDFSIRHWLEDEQRGFIFVTNYSDVKDTLKPILSLFIDLMGRKLLSMPDNPERRIFFMLDEFGTLQRLSTIVNLLTLSRSKGGSAWLGIQDIGQIDKIYTKELRQTIVNACGSNLIYSVSDPETADFFSRKLGETEFFEADETQHMGPSIDGDHLNISRKKKMDRLVIPAEVMNLKDLECYVKLPDFHVTKTKLQYRRYPDVTEPFVIREGLSL
jgi:type IV conjugative transfer system coupling protein TraD